MKINGKQVFPNAECLRMIPHEMIVFLTLNQRVAGSSPAAPTKQPLEIINDFEGFVFKTWTILS